MEKFKRIIDNLREMAASESASLYLLDYVNFLNSEFYKFDEQTKGLFINWLKDNVQSFDENCIYEIPEGETIEKYKAKGYFIVSIWYKIAIEYFIAKETIDLLQAKEILKRIKENTLNTVFTLSFEVEKIENEINILPQSQREAYLLKLYDEYFSKLKSITNNKNREFGETIYDPLDDEDWNLSNMLDSQNIINKETGYFWFPNYENKKPQDEPCLGVKDVFEMAVEPALELYYILQWIKNQLEPEQSKQNNQKPIIDNEYLTILFNRFKEDFSNETLESWLERFIYPSHKKIEKIKVSEKAKEGSNKLVLLALLDAIQQKKEGNFIYQNFVFDRFGIKAFDRAKNEHKEKETYQKTFKICSRILENDII